MKALGWTVGAGLLLVASCGPSPLEPVGAPLACWQPFRFVLPIAGDTILQVEYVIRGGCTIRLDSVALPVGSWPEP